MSYREEDQHKGLPSRVALVDFPQSLPFSHQNSPQTFIILPMIFNFFLLQVVTTFTCPLRFCVGCPRIDLRETEEATCCCTT